MMPTYRQGWISYGAGVNSTALLVLAAEGKLALYADRLRLVFCDTQDESDATYDYLFGVAMPYARKHEMTIEVCRPDEGVLERAERLNVTLSRVLRTCTKHGKIAPLEAHLRGHAGPVALQLIGIHAGEGHRAKNDPQDAEWPRFYPLVDMDIDQERCIEIIKAAGLPVPPKSGCWHCPFLRVGQILDLAKDEPEKFKRIVRLEMAANEAHPEHERTQWGDKPAAYWGERACKTQSSGPLFQEVLPDAPCICMFA